MKKLLQILLLSLTLVGCSSLELSDMPSSDTETARILALNLTHTENLNEANNLVDVNMSIAVIGKLQKIEDQKNLDIVKAENAAKYAQNVKVLNSDDDQVYFVGSEISETKRRGLLNNLDYHHYFLKGSKVKNNGMIQHKLSLSIMYSSDSWRNYYSASYCSKWDGCSVNSQIEIANVSSEAVSCNTDTCNYNEVLEIKLSDDFLKTNINTGFSINFNAKKVSNKVTIPSDYIMGYLQVAN